MNIRNWIQDQPAHIVLIALNVAVFAIQSLSIVLLGLFKITEINFIYEYFSLHSDLNELIFKPWGVFTYMFLHQDIQHLFWNMIFLYLIGRVFESSMNRSLTYSIFVVGGLISGLVTVISINVFPFFEGTGDHTMVGASGSIYAIILGITSYNPKANAPIFGAIAIPLLFLSIIKILGDLSSFYDGNTGGHIAHLSGATYGIIFGLQYKGGKNILSWYQKISSRFLTRKTRYNSNMKVVYNKNVQNVSDEDYNYSKQSDEQKLNDILEKVGKSGYDSLNKEEKEFLNFMSNR